MAELINIVTGFKDEPHVTSADDGSLNAGIFGEGTYILNRGQKMRAEIVNANTVRIYDGDVIMQGRQARIETGNYKELTIDNGAQGMKRNDLVIVRYTKDASTQVESMELDVIKGTATSGTPTDPSYTNGNIFSGAALAEYPLYRITINGLTPQTPVKVALDISSIDQIVDYVVEQGTRYIKWASGRAECWGSSTLASGSTSRTVSASLDVGMVGNYFVNITPYLNGSIVDKIWCGSIGGNNTKSSGQFDISAITNTSSYSVGVDWRAVGYWK